MKRRSFLKGLLGAIGLAATGIDVRAGIAEDVRETVKPSPVPCGHVDVEAVPGPSMTATEVLDRRAEYAREAGKAMAKRFDEDFIAAFDREVKTAYNKLGLADPKIPGQPSKEVLETDIYFHAPMAEGLDGKIVKMNGKYYRMRRAT